MKKKKAERGFLQNRTDKSDITERDMIFKFIQLNAVTFFINIFSIEVLPVVQLFKFNKPI